MLRDCLCMCDVTVCMLDECDLIMCLAPQQLFYWFGFSFHQFVMIIWHDIGYYMWLNSMYEITCYAIPYVCMIKCNSENLHIWKICKSKEERWRYRRHMNKERNQIRLCMSGVGRDWCRQLWLMQASGWKNDSGCIGVIYRHVVLEMVRWSG